VRERPGLSAFVLEDGVVYHTYSTYARGLDGSGACTSGSTARRRGATNRASGGVITTATKRWHDDRRAKRNRVPQRCCGAWRGRLARLCRRADLRRHGAPDLCVRRRRGHDVLGRAWCVAAERNGPDVSSDERLPLSAVAETALRSIGARSP
jgi:hypothetical protein